jgi:hypothetical protein
VPSSDTATQQAAASTGSVIGTWSGSGNETTPAFTAPADGNYIVSWRYRDNAGSNFAITATDGSADALGLPNDIASSGHGSTEATGASGTESFNVIATGHWKVTVVSA